MAPRRGVLVQLPIRGTATAAPRRRPPSKCTGPKAARFILASLQIFPTSLITLYEVNGGKDSLKVNKRIEGARIKHTMGPVSIKRYDKFGFIVREPFEHSEWIFEPKLDGFRALAYIEDGSCHLVSRRKNVYKSFPALCTAITTALPVRSAVLDGEIVCLDAYDRPHFCDLLRRRAPQYFYALVSLMLPVGMGAQMVASTLPRAVPTIYGKRFFGKGHNGGWRIHAPWNGCNRSGGAAARVEDPNQRRGQVFRCLHRCGHGQ